MGLLGVPHIYAGDDVSLFHAFGYAQMHSHANLLLRLFAKARGEAAAYGGAEYLELDRSSNTVQHDPQPMTWPASDDPGDLRAQRGHGTTVVGWISTRRVR